jgi:hypothetical protein
VVDRINLSDGTSEKPTRRDMLRRVWLAGVFATAGAGVSELLGTGSARAAAAQTTQLPATMILNALPTNAPPAIRAAIDAGCCVTYTLDEHHCGSGSCPSGYCCYHVVSTDCGLDEVACIEVGCSTGNFSTGC